MHLGLTWCIRSNVADINSEQEILLDAMARERDMASRSNIEFTTFEPLDDDDDGYAKQRPMRMVRVRATRSSWTRRYVKNVGMKYDGRGIDMANCDDHYPMMHQRES